MNHFNHCTEFAPNIILGYEVYNVRTKSVLKTYPPDKRQAATRYADKQDLKYGAITTSVRPIWKGK